VTTIAQARQIVGQQLGFSASFDGSVAAYRNLTPENQIRLTQGVFAYIKQNPGQFTDAQNATVAAESSRVDALTAENPGAFSVFVDAIADEALRVGGAVASVGNGVVTSVNLVGTLLPVAVLVSIVVFAWPYLKPSAPAAA